MTRFRFDSATAWEILMGLAARAYIGQLTAERGDRAERLLLHWWAVGHDPARALRSRGPRG